jgi:TonB family protein
MSYQALLFCPDDKTAKLVTQVLSELDFSVEPSNEPFTAVKRLMAQHFDAVVVDCDNEQNATLLFKSARNSASNQSSLAVAVVEGQAGVAKAFRIGANLVLTKPINVDQAKGTLRVARGLLKKGDASKAAAPAAAAPTASAPAAPTFTPAAPVQPATPAQPAAPVARPQAPLQQAPVQKPAFTQAVPKAPVVPPAQPQFAQAHASADVQESAVLDLSPDLAPSSKAAPVRPAQKEYAWQPVSKPTGPMASAFQHAVETQQAPGTEEIVDAPETAEFAEAAFAEPAAPPAPETPSYSAPVTTAGSAAAAAPAKQKVQVKAVVKPVARPIASAPRAAAPAAKIEPKPAAPANKLVITAPPEEEAPEAAPSAPAFSAYAEPAAQKSGSKTGLIALVALLVLGAAGYFGYTKLHKGSAPAPASQTTAVAPAAPAPGAGTAAAPVAGTEMKPSAGITPSTSTPAPATHTEVGTTLAKPETEADKKTTKPASSAKAEVEESVETAQPEPMIVKSGTPKPKPVQPAQVDAPDPMMASTGSSNKNLAGIVTSGITVATPVQQSLRISQGILQGQIIKKVQPSYPANALRMHTQGTVSLGATITKEGNVVNVKQLSGDKSLGAAAMDAVKQWKYKPYMLDGHPVEIQTTISVDFKLPS